MSLAALAGDWRRYNDLVVRALEAMTTDELELRLGPRDEASSTGWPIWAIAGHTAGARVYWLCTAAGRPGAASTPFSDPSGLGWEDDLGHPRSASELVTAWATTWAIVEAALHDWTPSDLDAVVDPGWSGGATFTRRSILLRLVTHEAFHAGEIAAIQAVHGLPPIDLWPPGVHAIDGPSGPVAADRGE